MEESEKQVSVSRVPLNSGLGRKQVMKRWDAWKEYISNGGTASWPRDEFEALLDAYEEIIRLAL